MKIVIIAGGSGTRLWPLSTSSFPKQLLKLTNEFSMAQNTFNRAKLIVESVKDIYVVTDISHADIMKEQLAEIPDENFIIEPGRKGTANCIIAALAYISSKNESDEPIAFISTDHNIRDIEGFRHSFNQASDFSNLYGKITLVGVEPNNPSTSFGYIEHSNEDNGVYRVESFKEKPDFKTAKKYLASGKYFWNCGYFVGSVNAFVSTMSKYSPELLDKYNRLKILALGTEDYKQVYSQFESESIDYALMEKAKDLLVVAANFDWLDIGSYKDLHEANESDEQGNHAHGNKIYIDETENAYIRNEEDKPVVVIGLDNIVVVNSPNGVLVARKDLSQKVGDIAKNIQ